MKLEMKEVFARIDLLARENFRAKVGTELKQKTVAAE